MNCILVVGANHESAMDAGTALAHTIVESKATVKTNGVMVGCCGLSVDEMRSLLNDAGTRPLPGFLRNAERKLVVSFDAAGNDLLSELQETITRSQDLQEWANSVQMEILQVCEPVIKYCREHSLSRLWLQKPMRGSSLDDRLGERLATAGFELCRLDPMVERYSNMRAVRAAALESVDGGCKQEVSRFWATLEPELRANSVDGVITNCNIPALVEYRDKNALPVALDVTYAYIDAILTWTEQPQL